ncbi:TonB family protein [Altererythrobacter arenosus]|uniref:TonB family protein n=1 Tax=Altererythrobacter arenosus TaxID=3032592 RepID=A0ABY8FVE4_9SPHN|nr:energy transducer TonB [Altererythrobacter sp. CAU 1644]WFL77913.1 TonB family protein [Altererythrobacter sp. CAU 1644]
MAYADRRSLRDQSAGLAGVVIVHAGLAGLLVFGLATDVTKEIFSGPLPTTEYKDPPPPPPHEPAQPKAEQNEAPIYTPPRPLDLPQQPNLVDTTTKLPPLSDEVILKVLPPVPDLGPPVKPSVSPIAAIPRNNPSRWVTDADYKSRWVREELYGTAKFRLDIAANGTVENCQITQSSGHAALDEATCALVIKRAKFKPATGGDGQPTPGSYSNAIRWHLPD